MALEPYVDPATVDRDNYVFKPTGMTWNEAKALCVERGLRTIMLAEGAHRMNPGDHLRLSLEDLDALDIGEYKAFAVIGWGAFLDYQLDHSDRISVYNNNSWNYAFGVTVPYSWLEGFTVSNSLYGAWQATPYVHWEWVRVLNTGVDGFKGHPDDCGLVSYRIYGEEVGVRRPYFGGNYPAGERGSMAHLCYPHKHTDPIGPYRFLSVLGKNIQGEAIRFNGDDDTTVCAVAEIGYVQIHNGRGHILDWSGGVKVSHSRRIVFAYDWDVEGREWKPWRDEPDADGNRVPNNPPPDDGKPWFLHGEYGEWPSSWLDTPAKMVPPNVWFVNTKHPRVFRMHDSHTNECADVTLWFARHIKVVDLLNETVTGARPEMPDEPDNYFGGKASYGPKYRYRLAGDDSWSFATHMAELPQQVLPFVIEADMPFPHLIYPPSSPVDPPVPPDPEEPETVIGLENDIKITRGVIADALRVMAERYPGWAVWVDGNVDPITGKVRANAQASYSSPQTREVQDA